MGCVIVKPIVDGIEAQYSGQLVVLRVNVQDPAGKTLAQEYNFIATPTFIFLDSQGRETWRSVGQIDPDRVANSLP